MLAGPSRPGRFWTDDQASLRPRRVLAASLTSMTQAPMEGKYTSLCSTDCSYYEKRVFRRPRAQAYGSAEDNINRSPQSVSLGTSGSMMVPMALDRSVPPPASRQAPARGSNHSAR